MSVHWHILLLGAVMMLGSCGTGYVDTEEELLAYVRDQEHGLIQEHESGGIHFQVMYRPIDLVVLQDVGTNHNSERIKSAFNRYGQYAYFIVSMDVQGKSALYGASGGMDQFSDNLQDLSFRMADRTYLLTDKSDTAHVVDYVFDRTYGMGSTRLMFVFPRAEMETTGQFTFTLEEFGLHVGNQAFTFNNTDIQHTPKIKSLYSSNDNG